MNHPSVPAPFAFPANRPFSAATAFACRSRSRRDAWIALALACVLTGISDEVSAQISFQPLSAVTAGTAVSSLAVGDFNSDGKLDVAVTDPDNSYIYLFLGDGHGSLAFGGARLVSNHPVAIVAADFNHDSKLDLAVASTAGGAGDAAILLGNGDGTFAPNVYYQLGAFAPIALAVGSFNPDGFVDLVVASKDPLCGTEPCGRVGLLRANGDGTFFAGWTAQPIATPADVATGAFTAGGDSDIALTNADGVHVYLGDGGGSFSASHLVSSVVHASRIVVADFNGDGKSDLAITIRDYMPTYVRILLGAGDGTLPAFSDYEAGSASGPSPAAAVADFDGDGKLDLAVTSQPADTIGVLPSKSSGTYDLFYPYLAFHGSLSGPNSIAAGDFTGDGKPDLAVGDSAGNVQVFVNLSGDRIFANGFEPMP